MEKDLVSIIVPVYNVEKYIQRCLDSLINQTYPAVEILLINDGSKDQSEQVCTSYAQRHPQIRYFKKENEGASKTRNFGMRHANGEYYMFVDSDDFVETDMIEKMMHIVNEEHADLVLAGYRMDYRFGSILRQTPCAQLWEKPEVLQSLLDNKAINNFAWGKLYHSSLFEGVEFPDCRFEDIYTIYQVFLKAKRIVSMPDRFYHYVQRRGSIMNEKGLLALDMEIVYEMRRAFEYQEKALQQAYPDAGMSNQQNFFNTDMLIIYTMLFFVKRQEIDHYPLPYLNLKGLPLFSRLTYRCWLGCAKLKFGKRLRICGQASYQ